MLYPDINAFPLEGENIPANIEIRVVFPAPLGPNKPNISLSLIKKFKLLTATFPLE